MLLLNRIVGFVAFILILVGLSGCSSSGTVPDTTPSQVAPGFALTAPAQLSRQVSATYSPLFRRGQEHVLDAVHGTTPGAGDDLVFSPSWNQASPDPAALSYAVYNFQLDGYTGPMEVSSSWDLEPDSTIAWIGISNFDINTWDWYAFPSSGLLAFDPLVSVDLTGVLLVAYVILDDTDYTLRYSRVGPDLPADAVLLADVQSGPAPLAVQLDAQFSEDFEGAITKFEFDPEGDGTFIDNGLVPSLNHNYTEAGSYLAAVRVTDTAMNTSVGTVRIGACWKHSWGGTGFEEGHATAVDTDGNTYVLGLTTTFGQGANELLILKYDPQGNILWQQTMGNGSGDDPGGIIVGGDGNIYICGSDLDPIADYRPFIFSLGPDGTLRWQVSWPTVGSTQAVGVAWGSDGSVYLACNHSEPFPAVADVLVIKYNATDGNQLWAKTWGTIQTDFPRAIVTDPAGNAYVLARTNSFSLLNAINNTAILGFDPDGNVFLETVYGLDTETTPMSLSYADGQLYLATVRYIAKVGTGGELNQQVAPTHDTDDISFYDILGIPGIGCFVAFAISPGMLDGGLLGIDADGQYFYTKAYRLNTAHQTIGGLSRLPGAGLMITGRGPDSSGNWEDCSLNLGDPGLEMTAVTGTVANHATVSIGSGYVLAEVPLGSEVIDAGGGNDDLIIQRFYPFEPSNW